MAYSLANRFQKPSECNTLLDPGSYQYPRNAVKPNKAPFLSKSPRKTATAATIWTHSIYNSAIPPTIPGCASLKSKTPRFPYESFSEKDLEEFLCRCGFPSICECSTEEEEEQEIVCQGNIRRRLFKGAPPHSTLGVGISAPSKRHRGFDIMPDGSAKQILEEIGEECPPFYDARVNEATAFYHGWKWSHWKSKRTLDSLEVKPGPADYDFEKKPTDYEICMEKFRENKRKTSKQLRYIEMVQRRHIIENLPGPASYSPELPKGTDLQFLGPKAARFCVSQHEVCPSPMTYNIKRAFDLPEAPEGICHAKLPVPAVFGTKAQRFKRSFVETPGPATYSPKIKIGSFLNCSKSPFGCSAKRFIDKPIIDYDDDYDDFDYIVEEEKDNVKICPPLTWIFRSRTLRTKPLIKQLNSPSPADFPQQNTIQSRSFYLQQAAPFSSSEGRFRPWNNWLPVHGKLQTPGPCQYNLEKPKCLPAVRCGPLYRARRFAEKKYPTPAPNEYKVQGGIENILNTHNMKLKNKIENQHKFKWEPNEAPEQLTYKEQELLLIKKTIELLDPERSSRTSTATTKEKKSKESVSPNRDKEKLLRCFLYEQSYPHYF